MTLKVAGILRRRYVKWKAASNIFRKTLLKMAFYGYVMSTTSKVIYSMQGFLGLPKDTRSVMAPMGSILFLLKPWRGFDGSLSCFQSNPILLKVARKRIFGLAAIIDEDFGYISSVDVDCNDHGMGVQE
jgi:hypothetical protein